MKEKKEMKKRFLRRGFSGGRIRLQWGTGRRQTEDDGTETRQDGHHRQVMPHLLGIHVHRSDRAVTCFVVCVVG